MKKIIKKEITFCDKCDKEYPYLNKCLNCNVEMCYDCVQKHGESYDHAVYFRGSGDGFYCKPCNQELKSIGKDKRYNAYLTIRLLQDELETWGNDFKKRQDNAERILKNLIN